MTLLKPFSPAGLLSTLLAALLVSCAAPKPQEPVKLDWTAGGSGAFHSASGPIFSGSGISRKHSQQQLIKGHGRQSGQGPTFRSIRTIFECPGAICPGK